MNRRDWMRAAGMAAPAWLAAAPPSPPADSAIEAEIVRLKLRHTWTTTMSSSEYRDTLHFRYTSAGITGRGEGAPIVRYKESAETGSKAIAAIRDLLAASDPWKYRSILETVFAKLPGEWAAKSAIDIALHDWVGQKLGVPLYRYFGLDPAQ